MRISDALHHIDGPGLLTAGEKWESPAFPVVPFTYYRISFSIKASGKSLWAVFFSDQDGEPLVADNYSDVEQTDELTAFTFCKRANYRAASARLRFHAPAGGTSQIGDITITAIDRREGAAILENTISGMPALHYTPPTDHLCYLSDTVKKLREGGPFRIVMLGDSIVNDLNNSLFDLMLASVYPDAEIQVIPSVGASIGCDYYRQPGKVQEFVLDLMPDLLIIGGISNKDIESIRDVVRQVRAALPAEILLMTPVLKLHEDPDTGKPWTMEIDPTGNGMRGQQWRLAREEQLAFVDLAGPFTQYALSPGVSYAWLKRDSHHAGLYGKLVLGQILARYLS